MLDTAKVWDWLERNERTQAWLARKCGYSLPYIHRCLREQGNPSERVIDSIEDAMRLRRGELRLQPQPAQQVGS